MFDWIRRLFGWKREEPAPTPKPWLERTKENRQALLDWQVRQQQPSRFRESRTEGRTPPDSGSTVTDSYIPMGIFTQGSYNDTTPSHSEPYSAPDTGGSSYDNGGDERMGSRGTMTNAVRCPACNGAGGSLALVMLKDKGCEERWIPCELCTDGAVSHETATEWGAKMQRADRLRAVRKAIVPWISIREGATRCGMDVVAYSKLELGKAPMTEEECDRLCAALSALTG